MEGVHGQLPVRQACPADGVRPADRRWPGRLHAAAHADEHPNSDAHGVEAVDLRTEHADVVQPYADAHDARPDRDADADHVFADAYPIAAHPIADADRVAQNHVRGCPGDARGTG
jgi:hypothetical protein